MCLIGISGHHCGEMLMIFCRCGHSPSSSGGFFLINNISEWFQNRLANSTDVSIVF